MAIRRLHTEQERKEGFGVKSVCVESAGFPHPTLAARTVASAKAGYSLLLLPQIHRDQPAIVPYENVTIRECRV